MAPAQHLIDRFTRDFDELIAPGKKVGIAVSGGPDSLALLLLAATARPGTIEAATVDHRFRPESVAEAEMVSRLCEKLGVPHATLKAEWLEKPTSAIQEQARIERYRLLVQWAKKRGLEAVATAHHADDQAETFLMRLMRGSGVRGLAGMRRSTMVPGSDIPLLRPLLGWRREELEQLCHEAGIEPANDPSNADAQFERVRVRTTLSNTASLDATAIASSAAILGEADDALEWATDQEWQRGISQGGSEIVYRADAPPEIQRRILGRIIALLGTEGDVLNLRGKEVDRLVVALSAGQQATIRGVRCQGGAEWRFSKSPPRR